MAFMMPVVKNDYDIYASRSRRSSTVSNPRSRRSTRCESNPPSLSCSPGSDVEERLRAVESERERRISRNESRSHCASEPPSPKSASHTSLNKFHTRLVDKLKRTLGMKDDSSEDNAAKSESSS